MAQIARDSLMTLEAYAKARPQFRAGVLAHKKLRTVHLGDHVTLIFEDELTIRYQIQEMLRIEKTFEEAGIKDELDARRHALARLKGIERSVWIEVEGEPKVFAIADEDLDRETAAKTSAVHFLRFELTPVMVEALRRGHALGMGIDHPDYQARIPSVPEAARAALVADLA